MAMRKKSGRQSGRQLMRESYSGRIFSLRQTFWQDNVLVQMLMYGKEAKNKNKRQSASTTLFRTKKQSYLQFQKTAGYTHYSTMPTTMESLSFHFITCFYHPIHTFRPKWESKIFHVRLNYTLLWEGFEDILFYELIGLLLILSECNLKSYMKFH